MSSAYVSWLSFPLTVMARMVSHYAPGQLYIPSTSDARSDMTHLAREI